ncbi:MAG: hypothetical protein LBJ33_01020 [Pseudomonas putida]|nr:hypothetical protein [Pseudomonas putida]
MPFNSNITSDQRWPRGQALRASAPALQAYAPAASWTRVANTPSLPSQDVPGMATAKDVEKAKAASAWQAMKEHFNHGAGLIVNDKPDEKLKRVLRAQGVVFTNAIEAVGRDRDTGLYVFIQNAGMKGGMSHVVDQHVEEFRQVGALSNAQIRELVINAVTTGTHIATQGKNRPVYAIRYLGQVVRVAVSVGVDGYVIGANISKLGDLLRAPQARWNRPWDDRRPSRCGSNQGC